MKNLSRPVAVLPLVSALLSALSPLAGAQVAVPAFDKAVATGQTEASGSPARAAIAARGEREQAVRSMRAALGDGIEAGGQVLAAMDRQGVSVEFRAQTEAASMETVRGPHSLSKVLYLSESLPLYPRVLAAYAAREVLKGELADMPACAEQAYMRVSLLARTWLELGGDADRLPVIEPLVGYRDEALAKDLWVWTDHDSQTALSMVGGRTIPEQTAAIDRTLADKDPYRKMTPLLLQDREALKAANARFLAFITAENQWRRLNGR